MSKNERFYLAEDPMQEDGPQFVVDMLHHSVFNVVITTDINAVFREFEASRDATIAAYGNPDGIVEWVMVSSNWEGADCMYPKHDDALRWYLDYLNWEDRKTPVLFKPYSDELPEVFAFRARDREQYALLHLGMIEIFDDVLALAERIQILYHPANITPGHINQIAWPAN